MPRKLPPEWLDELRARVDIVSVVGESVPLKQKGKYLWACCPFHNEKSPSFKVDSESQMFYCFGCHKGGNVISYVMEYDRLEFMEAVESLAERAHMQLPDRLPDTVEDDRASRLRENIFEANLHAARFFHSLLWEQDGMTALKYLYARGLNDADIKRFGLGASPRGGDGLYKSLKEAGFSDEVIDGAWLCGSKDGRHYDMFRDRVIFPILSAQGKVLGFGGRIMGEGNPKYLNTSDTPVFNKRNGLYALNFAKKQRPLSRLVLVEGYMDTVSLLKHDIPGVVATLGTALTEEQARLMKRYAPEVWISYDGDAPGQKAALRALDILGAQGVRARVIAYPSSMDPDDYIKTYGKDAWDALRKLLPTEYRMQRAKDGLDTTIQEDRSQYAIRCCEILKSVTSPVELEDYVKKLSHDTGYGRDVLMRQIGAAIPAGDAQSPKPRNLPARTATKRTEAQVAQMQLIALLNKELIPGTMLEKDDFDSALYADMAMWLSEGIKSRDFIADIPEEQVEEALEALNYDILPEDPQKAMDMAEDCLRTIRQSRINQQITVLTMRLSGTTDEERSKLNLQLNALLAKLETYETGRKGWRL